MKDSVEYRYYIDADTSLNFFIFKIKNSERTKFWALHPNAKEISKELYEQTIAAGNSKISA